MPNADLNGLVHASNRSFNSQAEFEMHVFTIGDDSRATIECDMFLERNQEILSYDDPTYAAGLDYFSSMNRSFAEDLTHVSDLGVTPNGIPFSPTTECQTDLIINIVDYGYSGSVEIIDNSTSENCFVTFGTFCTSDINVELTYLNFPNAPIINLVDYDYAYDYNNDYILNYNEKCYETIHFEYTDLTTNQTMNTIPQCGCLKNGHESCSSGMKANGLGNFIETPTTTHLLKGIEPKIALVKDGEVLLGRRQVKFDWSCAADNTNDII